MIVGYSQLTYIVVGGIDIYFYDIMCNKKKAEEKKNQMKCSVTLRSGTAEKCFHFSLKAAKRPSVSFKHEHVPNPQSWNC